MSGTAYKLRRTFFHSRAGRAQAKAVRNPSLRRAAHGSFSAICRSWRPKNRPTQGSAA